MKTLIRATLAVLMLVGCFTQNAQAQNLEQKILGRWEFSAMELTLDDKENASNEIVQQFEAMQTELSETNDKLKGKAFFNFQKGGAMTLYDENDGEKKGTWKVSGKQVVMAKEDGGEEQKFDVAIEDGTLRLIMRNPEIPNLAITFVMKK